MPPGVTSQRWPADRALLLCHGVGNYGPGDYDGVKAALRDALGAAAWNSIAVYEVFYDEVNDWFAQKTQLAQAVTRALQFMKAKFDTSVVAQAAAEGAADIIWPVLSLPARDALRRAYISQLLQMVIDGEDPSGVSVRDQKIVVMGHSLGCFHTYEALWATATDPQYHMLPAFGQGPVYRSVILIASPVQMIRGVAREMSGLVPDRDRLATTRDAPLAVPAQVFDGQRVPVTKKLLSLTGSLDPVGGFLLGNALDWAYMDIDDPLFQPHVEPQHLVNRPADADLATLFTQMAGRRRPDLTLENPHSWERYVSHNADLIRQCVLA
jgi:hypothetical protein